MNYDYVIRLKRPNYRAVDIISQLLVLIFLVTAVRNIIVSYGRVNWLWSSALPAVVLLLWILNLTKPKAAIVFYRLPLLIAATGWLMLAGGWSWITLVYAALALLEPQVKFPDEIGFTKEKIVRNTFPKKTYEWIDIDSVLISNNLFTLDLRNNKLIQKELETPVTASLQEEFNAYCLQQLHFTPDMEREAG